MHSKIQRLGKAGAVQGSRLTRMTAYQLNSQRSRIRDDSKEVKSNSRISGQARCLARAKRRDDHRKLFLVITPFSCPFNDSLISHSNELIEILNFKYLNLLLGLSS